jgi:hypothetical protein
LKLTVRRLRTLIRKSSEQQQLTGNYEELAGSEEIMKEKNKNKKNKKKKKGSLSSQT